MATDIETGILLGILIGEGHFGGDGRQPQVTLRMHVRHRALFYWLQRTFPGGRLYGPYNHGGREYYQWMIRGQALRDELLPLLEQHLSPALDEPSYERVQTMRERYRSRLTAKDSRIAIPTGGDLGLMSTVTAGDFFDRVRAKSLPATENDPSSIDQG